MNIKNISKEDRPRERLKNNGARSLSNAELLAIIIGFGSKDLGVLELAEFILKTYPLNTLANLDYNDLISIKGLKDAKASKILALFELARRSNLKINNHLGDTLAVYEFIKPRYLYLNYEVFTLLILNRNNYLIKDIEISNNSSSFISLNLNNIIEFLIKYKASKFIIVHNHPANNLKPSSYDLEFTSNLKEAASIFSFKLVDHLIITDFGYFSFKESSLL